MDESKEPQEPGWYTYSGGAQNMIFLRAPQIGARPLWFAVFNNGTIAAVNWGYIEQALGVWDLVPLVPLQESVEIFHTRDCQRRQSCARSGCYVVATGEPVGKVKT